MLRPKGPGSADKGLPWSVWQNRWKIALLVSPSRHSCGCLHRRSNWLWARAGIGVRWVCRKGVEHKTGHKTLLSPVADVLHKLRLRDPQGLSSTHRFAIGSHKDRHRGNEWRRNVPVCASSSSRFRRGASLLALVGDCGFAMTVVPLIYNLITFYLLAKVPRATAFFVVVTEPLPQLKANPALHHEAGRCRSFRYNLRNQRVVVFVKRGAAQLRTAFI